MGEDNFQAAAAGVENDADVRGNCLPNEEVVRLTSER